jgi:segregation and condensation protein A
MIEKSNTDSDIPGVINPNGSAVSTLVSDAQGVQPEPGSHQSVPENRLNGGKEAHKGEQNDFPFAVEVGDIYEGPLDLLLDLIRKQDIDIYDIPIARITAQYLKYVEKIRELDVNVAADFIYMA